jgi:hypothetical protein
MSAEYSPSGDFYDNFPNGVGEIPDSHVPVEVVREVTGLGVKVSYPGDTRTVREIVASGVSDKVTLHEALTTGPAAVTIESAQEDGNHVGFKWGVHKVELFVARHPQAILAVGAAITVFSAAAVGALHILEHKKAKE